MDCKRIPHYPNDLKKEIIQKVKNGIKRTSLQKEYGISSATLSRWVCPPDKIVAKVMGEIQPEENVDIDLKCAIVKKALTGVNKYKILEDHNIGAETLEKCYTKWFTPNDKIVAKVMSEIDDEENQKKRNRESDSDDDSVIKKQRLDSDGGGEINDTENQKKRDRESDYIEKNQKKQRLDSDAEGEGDSSSDDGEGEGDSSSDDGEGEGEGEGDSSSDDGLSQYERNEKKKRKKR